MRSRSLAMRAPPTQVAVTGLCSLLAATEIMDSIDLLYGLYEIDDVFIRYQ